MAARPPEYILFVMQSCKFCHNLLRNLVEGKNIPNDPEWFEKALAAVSEEVCTVDLMNNPEGAMLFANCMTNGGGAERTQGKVPCLVVVTQDDTGKDHMYFFTESGKLAQMMMNGRAGLDALFSDTNNS